MDPDTVDDVGDFHSMDVALVPYKEDPKVIMLRDWPPAYCVYLRYQPNGKYLCVKKGALVLSSNPYVLFSAEFRLAVANEVRNCLQQE